MSAWSPISTGKAIFLPWILKNMSRFKSFNIFLMLSQSFWEVFFGLIQIFFFFFLNSKWKSNWKCYILDCCAPFRFLPSCSAYETFLMHTHTHMHTHSLNTYASESKDDTELNSLLYSGPQNTHLGSDENDTST